MIEFHDDKKEKHQSVSAKFPIIDKQLEELHWFELTGYGRDQQEATSQLVERSKCLLAQLEVTKAHLVLLIEQHDKNNRS